MELDDPLLLGLSHSDHKQKNVGLGQMPLSRSLAWKQEQVPFAFASEDAVVVVVHGAAAREDGLDAD